MMAKNLQTLFDANVKIGHWPYRPVRDGESVLRAMADLGVCAAAVSSLNAVHYLNPQDGNDELHAFVTSHFDQGVRLVPLAVLRPGFACWRDDLRRCVADYGMRGIMLYPAYHGYALSDPELAPLLTEAANAALPVFVQTTMEDPRRQFRPYKTDDVAPETVGTVACNHPEVTIVALGLKFGQPEGIGLPWPDNLYFDISNYEHLNDLEAAVQRFGASRILFGSNMPMFNPRANIDKLRCAVLSETERAAIAFRNMETILGDAP